MQQRGRAVRQQRVALLHRDRTARQQRRAETSGANKDIAAVSAPSAPRGCERVGKIGDRKPEKGLEKFARVCVRACVCAKLLVFGVGLGDVVIGEV